MSRPRSDPPKKSPELIRAETRGHQLLRDYCRVKVGVQADLVRKTGIYPATVSKMSNGKTPITLEAAIQFEVATGGALRADVLCPSRADLLKEFKADSYAPVEEPIAA